MGWLSETTAFFIYIDVLCTASVTRAARKEMLDGLRLSSASGSMTRCMSGLRTVSSRRPYQGAVALLRFYLVTSSSLVLFFLAWRLQSLHKDRMRDLKSATNA
jgi:hypothetical protein